MLAVGKHYHMVITKNIPIKEWLKWKRMWANNEGEAEKLQKDVDKSHKTTVLKYM
jgi:dephospho-CoA kinase